MAKPELISSSFKPSTIPGAIIVDTEWRCNGLTYWGIAIVVPDAPSKPAFWEDVERQMTHWFNQKHRRTGEINELHGC